jgi:hypothetical protein
MVKNWLRTWLNVLGFFIVAAAMIAVGGFSFCACGSQTWRRQSKSRSRSRQRDWPALSISTTLPIAMDATPSVIFPVSMVP